MTIAPRIDLGEPRDAVDLAAVRALFVEYSDSLGFSLAYQGFDAELAALPGDYAPPSGALLLARVDGVAAGTVGLRRVDGEQCEMKRLFVRPACRAVRTAHGRSLGRELVSTIVEHARVLGYRRMRLDTIAGSMQAAIALYRSAGFVEVAPWFASPVPGTLFFEKRL